MIASKLRLLSVLLLSSLFAFVSELTDNLSSSISEGLLNIVKFFVDKVVFTLLWIWIGFLFGLILLTPFFSGFSFCSFSSEFKSESSSESILKNFFNFIFVSLVTVVSLVLKIKLYNKVKFSCWWLISLHNSRILFKNVLKNLTIASSENFQGYLLLFFRKAL